MMNALEGVRKHEVLSPVLLFIVTQPLQHIKQLMEAAHGARIMTADFHPLIVTIWNR